MNIKKREINITGLLPNASDILPITGENKNCINAYDAYKKPPQIAASDTENLPTDCNISGIIGKITIKPLISNTTVKKIKPIAFFLGCFNI